MGIDPPKWLREALDDASRLPIMGGTISETIPVGQRNVTLTSLAGTMRRRGMSEEAIHAGLLAENDQRCTEPLPGEEVRAIAKSISRYEPELRQEHSGLWGESTSGLRKPKPNLGERLTQLCEARLVDFFCDQSGRPHVALPIGGHTEVWPTEGRPFYPHWMAEAFRAEFGAPPPSEALKQARTQIEVRCYSGPRRVLHNRVAWRGESVLYDLSDDGWRGVEISHQGWQIIPIPPIFRRYDHQIPQVEPARGGSLGCLSDFLTVAPRNRLLFLVAIISWFIPDIPHPIVILTGEPGTGKSATTRAARDLVDPSRTPILAPPRNNRVTPQVLEHNWVAPFDNVSDIPPWLADSLCRAITGEGVSDRQLYTNDQDMIRTYRRCVLINGIGNPTLRADLLDRALVIETERPAELKDEASLWRAWATVITDNDNCCQRQLELPV